MAHRFDVWAPRAGSAEVVLADGRRHPLAPSSPPGWLAADVDDAGPGTDYGFSLDGGPALPDPRSPWQPGGPDGPSRVVDHGAFGWTDRAWRGIHLPAAVVYEIHVGTFSPEGTFEGAIGRLDHLVDLGITAVEVMPVAEFPGPRGWGYDGVDLYAPHHAYGGPEALKRLIDACHQRGLGVILDVVYNHLGPAGNYLDRYGPYFTDRHQTPWGQAVNFEGPGSDEVRRYFVDNALMWLGDYHCDGLRLDAVHAIVDTSAVHVLEQLADEVARLAAATGVPRWLIAESDLNDPRLVRPPLAGGYGLDAQWSDDFHHAVHALLTGERSGYYADFGTVEDLGTALQHAYVYAGRYSAHRERSHGRPATGLPGWAFLGYSQNHDQVGNRATGERSAALLSPGRVRVAAALVLTAPFVPLLFQGEEWAASTPFQYFTSHPDAELGRAVSEGRRREFSAFGWDPSDVPDPQDLATFERSVLDWSEPTHAEHRAVLDWYRELIALRRRDPDLTDGRLDRVGFARAGEAAFSVRRGSLVVAVNIGPGRAVVPLRPDAQGHESGAPARILLASDESCRLTDGGAELGPDSVAVVRSR
ncbi:MAG TPA: malto-oligosyltrehalose trehalohydrolase [Acidimicrobiales bacterium]|nr:malto-oligosyltrehalose trehalohydrolase [Acidimicrobiales bacterium]